MYCYKRSAATEEFCVAFVGRKMQIYDHKDWIDVKNVGVLLVHWTLGFIILHNQTIYSAADSQNNVSSVFVTPR